MTNSNKTTTIIVLNQATKHVKKKPLQYFLMSLPNIQNFLALRITLKLGFSKKTKIRSIKTPKFSAFLLFLDYEVSDRYTYKKALIDSQERQEFLNTYKSKRRRLNLPTNGQRTRSNAKTSKHHKP